MIKQKRLADRIIYPEWFWDKKPVDDGYVFCENEEIAVPIMAVFNYENIPVRVYYIKTRKNRI